MSCRPQTVTVPMVRTVTVSPSCIRFCKCDDDIGVLATADPTPSVTSQEPGAETVTVVSATSASGSGEVGTTSAPAPAQVNLAPVQVNPAPAQVNAPSLSSATTANMTTVATTTPTVVPPVQAHANAVAATTLPVPASGSFERWYIVTKGLVPGVYNGWCARLCFHKR
jgi:hypothetical protein